MQATQKALAICYELLPKSMQLIANLRFKQDESLKFISKSVNRPLGAISSTLYRVRQKLVDCVQDKVLSVEANMDFNKNFKKG